MSIPEQIGADLRGAQKRRIITPAEAAAELLKRRQIKKSLHSFTKEAWHTWEGGRPFRDNWHIGALCEHVEAVIAGQIPNLLVNVPPRSTKTSVIGVALVPWAWSEDPGIQFLCTTYDANLSQRDHRAARQVIQSEWYRVRNPRLSLLDDQNTKVRYVNNFGGFRLSTAVEGANTGEGGDVLVCLPYEAEIWTEHGRKCIGDVVTMRAAEFVLAFDHETAQPVLARILGYEENAASDMIEIDCGDGVRLTCTENHPVYVEGRGYVPAREILEGDQVIILEREWAASID